MIIAGLLAGAFGASAATVSANFNAYTAPFVLAEGTYVDAPLSNIVSVLDSDTNGAFKVYGGVGINNTNSSYSAKILGNNTGSNYLELRTVKGNTGYNLISQISTASPMPLSTNWGVNVRFSVNKNGTLGQGSQYFGLYASGAMSPTLGGYDYVRLGAANNTSAAAALGFSINQIGLGTLVRTGSDNKHQFWNGSAWQPTSTNFVSGLDLTGATQYDLALRIDGPDLSIKLVNAGTLATIIELNSPLSELGSNITTANTVRFSAGDIAGNSTENWTINLYSLSFQTTRPTLSLIIFKN